MRILPKVVGLVCCLLVCGCAEDPASPEESPSPEVIRQLARQERSVEELDVCQALRAARGEADLARLVGAESIAVEGGFVDSEDAAVADCSVSPKGRVDIGLRVSVSQGGEFSRARTDDPVVFPGCRVASPVSEPGRTSVRVTCRPDLAVEAMFISDGDAVPDSDALVSLLGDVLVRVSQHG